MTVEEVQDRKAKLEQQIKHLVAGFHSDTCCKVDCVDVERHEARVRVVAQL